MDKELDVHFKRLNQKIYLLMDNFPGLKINYKPKNIHLECFEANMTSFVQLLDSGIIRCKAHYCKTFCLCALDLDEARADNIYKIKLCCQLKQPGMQSLSKPSQTAGITQVFKIISECQKFMGTIYISQNCRPTLSSTVPTQSPLQDVKAWSIIKDFLHGICNSMPDTEELHRHLDNQYVAINWKPAFDAIFKTKDNAAAFLHLKYLSCCKSSKSNGLFPLVTPASFRLYIFCHSTIMGLPWIRMCKKKTSHAANDTPTKPKFLEIDLDPTNNDQLKEDVWNQLSDRLKSLSNKENSW